MTRTLCPTCLNEIPATISVEDMVYIDSACPEHGTHRGVVEKSAAWWDFCREVNSPKIYDGYMLDITSKCNIQCKYCYHDNQGTHKTLDLILEEIEQNKHLAPFIITGGEPTTHPALRRIIAECSTHGQVWLLTNGVMLSDEDFFSRLVDMVDYDGVLGIGLSFHRESNGADIKLLNLCREKGKRIGTTFYVIDTILQIEAALAIYEEYKDVICSMRIKAASNLWGEQNANNKIFTSDMVSYILSKGGVFDHRYSNKVSYASMLLNGMELRLCAWYDKDNIDLDDIDGPPYCKANDESVNNLVTTCFVNERLSCR